MEVMDLKKTDYGKRGVEREKDLYSPYNGVCMNPPSKKTMREVIEEYTGVRPWEDQGFSR